MPNLQDFNSKDPIAWCPGCGDFGILNALKNALVSWGKTSKEIVLVSGIGQAAKLPHYIKCNCFNGLHGRALPVASAIKIANRNLTVIVTTGEGDCYGEGGNHFIHNIRRNTDITVIVHNNQIYGLTKGQASPTTECGHVTKVQTKGVIVNPFHPLEVAIALDAGFVARGYSADSKYLASLILEGIKHKGFSLIDVLQPCISFNKINTYEWYANRIYKVDEDKAYNPLDKSAALKKAAQWPDKIPLGILYKKEAKTYEEKSGLEAMEPLVDQPVDSVDINSVFKDFA